MSSQLSAIQKSLKAPKNKKNSFGNYKYRSCEDILEAVKPLLGITGTTLTLSDALECIGTRYYIKATATLVDNETKKVIAQTTAYAREDEVKKGMDGSQITGTASSYARKYALNGLFLIDDTKDADTNEYKEELENRRKEAEAKDIIEKKVAETAPKKIKKTEATALAKRIENSKIITIEAVCKQCSVEKLEDLTYESYDGVCNYLQSKGA